MFYDFVLTLDDEFELFWARKWSFMTFLFVANRYFAVIVDTPFGLIYGLSFWSSKVSVVNLCVKWAF